jgi:MoaA/NifB/PqqE/SkfB family radical SAM enzyme
VHVTKRNGQIQIASKGLASRTSIPFDPERGSIYDQALAVRQHEGAELDLEGKMRVLEHLAGVKVKLDISGGDPLAVAENFLVLQAASDRFGRSGITLTATGSGLSRYAPADIAPLIGELNFTYDNLLPTGNESRPAGYANGNLRKAAQFAKAGVRTRAEGPLTTHNIGDDILRQLYLNLHHAGIDKFLIMRLFPVGRGAFRAHDVPSIEQYRRAISVLREMAAKYTYPVVKLQCALKFLDEQNMDSNPCDVIHESFGLQPDGTLLASPWAVGPHGAPLHDVWVLGNLATTPITEILASERVRALEARLDENFGHCKIHAFLASPRRDPYERMLDRADPLYSKAGTATETPMHRTRVQLPVLGHVPFRSTGARD